MRNRMMNRLSLLLLCAPLVSACLQTDPGPEGKMPPCDFGSVCPAPSDGVPPTMTTTPEILLNDGTTTTDPCVKNEQDSMTIRQTYCGGCHAAPAQQGAPPFSFILDDATLTTTLAPPVGSTAALLFVNPGDPSTSRIYQRIVNQEMPPVQRSVDQPDYPRPTFSDVSVLYAWIMCLKH